MNAGNKPSSRLLLSRILREWWSWLLMLGVSILIFYTRSWNLHFLIKVGVLFALALLLVTDMSRRTESVCVTSDEDLEGEFSPAQPRKGKAH